jgi:hypothetical protein
MQLQQRRGAYPNPLLVHSMGTCLQLFCHPFMKPQWLTPSCSMQAKQLCAAGAVPGLLDLLGSTDPAAQVGAVLGVSCTAAAAPDYVSPYLW